MYLHETRRWARLGSFGEHLFADVMRRRGHIVEALHAEQTDFLVDGQRIDVKSSFAKTVAPFKPLKQWSGNRVDGEQYAQV